MSEDLKKKPTLSSHHHFYFPKKYFRELSAEVFFLNFLNKTKWAYNLLYMTITNRNVLRPFQNKYLYFGHFLEELNASEWHFFHLIISSLLAIIVKNLNHAVEVKILNFPSCFITLYISCEDSLKYVSF